MNTPRTLFLIFCLSLILMGCKKESALDPLSNVLFSKAGIIRVECADCVLNYTVLKDNYAVDIVNNEDVKFNYTSDFELKTTINAQKQQTIRLIVFDSYGRLISNELSTLDSGEIKTDSFKIQIK